VQLGWLNEVVTHEGPVASVHADVTRSDPQGGHTEALHRRGSLAVLREQGAPETVLDVVADRLTAGTGQGGDQGRHLVVAEDGEVLLDLLVAHRPDRDEASWGAVPSLLPLLRALDGGVAHLLVRADRVGADVVVVDSLGRQVVADDVEGGHDVLTKVRGGGWSHRRMQSRVDDSWERNADAVVDTVRRLVERHHPEVVLLTGDPHACGLVRNGLADDLGDRLRWVRAGGRADGVDAEAEQAEVDEILREVRLRRMGTHVAELEQGLGQDALGVVGLPAVVTAVQRAAVERLLLDTAVLPPGDDSPQLWTSTEGTVVGTSEGEVLGQGATSAVPGPARDVLVRAVAAQSGRLELVDGVTGVLEQGVGAVLRFDVRPRTPGG
jgi:hypothetical protein